MSRSLRTGPTAFAVALLLAGLAIAMLVAAYSYSRSSGLFPIFVGWIFLALTVLEIVVQLRALRPAGGQAVGEGGAAATASIDALREFGGFFWLGSMLLLLYGTGFLLATPVFMFAFLRFAARRTVVQSIAIALLATAFVYVVFAWLLDYELYPGVLFGG
ncbi:MAG: tripartite tricarboxylate transporter TctB family protein [Gammaproteobacteria bacterium]|nr:tripartite tricarboxylate transporter TctB family protein [Gammaproteobacteria bacterium]